MQIITYTGKYVDVCKMSAGDVDIETIAHALSMQCRFGGHTKEFYSVAQHCCRVADVLPDKFRLAGLLHDASEAYLVDLPTPVKEMMPFYAYTEKFVHCRVADAFSIPFDVFFHDKVKEADCNALWTEWVELIGAPLPDDLIGKFDFLPRELPMSPAAAEQRFLVTFHALRELNKTAEA